jgi:general L-amino acid transport system substrate-binding protein
VCVTLAAPGFSAEDNSGKREGFDVDLCKAIAAATLGDESKIQLVPMDLKTAFAGLPPAPSTCSPTDSRGRRAAT